MFAVTISTNCFGSAEISNHRSSLVIAGNQTRTIPDKTLALSQVLKNFHEIDLNIKKRNEKKHLEKEYETKKALSSDEPIKIDHLLNSCGATIDDFETLLDIALKQYPPGNLDEKELLLQIKLSDVFNCQKAMEFCVKELANRIKNQSALNDDNELLAQTTEDLPDTVLNYKLQPVLVHAFKKNLNQITRNCSSTIEPKNVRQMTVDDKKKFLLFYLQNGKVKQVGLENNRDRKTFSTRRPQLFDTLLRQKCSHRGGMKLLPGNKICVWSEHKRLMPFRKKTKTTTHVSIWNTKYGTCEKRFDAFVGQEDKNTKNSNKKKTDSVKILHSFSRKKREKKVSVFGKNTVIVLSGSGRPKATVFEAASDAPVNEFNLDSESVIISGENCITLTQKNNDTIKMAHWNPLTGAIEKTVEARGKLPQKIHYTNHNNDVLLNIKDNDGVEWFVNCSSGEIVREAPSLFAKYDEKTKTIEILEVKEKSLQQKSTFDSSEKMKDLIILPDQRTLISLSKKGTVKKHLITPFKGLSLEQTVLCALVAQKPKGPRSKICKHILANLPLEIRNGIKKL